MELTAVINDIVLTPEAMSLAEGEGPNNEDALIREAHFAFGGGASGFSGKDGGPGHRRATITQDAASYLARQLSWVHFRGSNLVVRVGRCVCASGGLNTQNTRGLS